MKPKNASKLIKESNHSSFYDLYSILSGGLVPRPIRQISDQNIQYTVTGRIQGDGLGGWSCGRNQGHILIIKNILCPVAVYYVPNRFMLNFLISRIFLVSGT
jgi:hypothetical protein